MQRDLPVRKHPRLKGYDYSKNGAYFITLCVKDGHEMLGTFVGRDVLIAPGIDINVPVMESPVAESVELSEYGDVVNKHINKINLLCKGILVDKYVIMPNHIHMIIIINHNEMLDCNNGAMKTSRPTSASVPSVMRSFKTMVTKEIGFSLWQDSYHDRIIRDENEYHTIWRYIDENPARWVNDKYYGQYNGQYNGGR